MIKISSGQMICNIRTMMNIKQIDLCRGLCSVSVLSKYESGERVPDTLLFHALLQRMGKSPSRISMMISEQDAAYYEWKIQISDAINEKDWELVKKLREAEKNSGILINEMLQRQYEEYVDAVIAEKVEHNMEKFYENMKKAVEETIPFADKWTIQDGLISSDELNMLYMYFYGEKMMGIQDVEKQMRIFEQIEAYIEEKVDDMFEKAKTYPRMVCAENFLLREAMTPEERIWRADKALHLLKSTKEIYDMPEILRILIIDLKGKEDERAARYEKQRQALAETMEEFGVSTEFSLEKWYSGNEGICLINEYLRVGREEKQLTQEKLSEDICEVETYSRIESGKRAPSVKNYCKLAEKLDINWGYYRGQIVTTHYKDLLLMTEQRQAAIRGEWETAKRLLFELKKHLDMDEIENRQYVEMMEVTIAAGKKELTLGQQEQEYLKILQYTIPVMENKKSFLTKTEIELVFLIAKRYRAQKKYEEAKVILEYVVQNEQRRRFSSWYETGGTERLLAGVYSDLKEYETSLINARRCIQKMFMWQDGQMLDECLNLIGWDLELSAPQKKKDYDSYYVRALYISDLYENREKHDACEKYYINNINSEKKWY